MKKRQRKLTLNRETIRNLERMEMRRVAGGCGDTNEIQTGCACETEGPECGCGTGSCGGTCASCAGCGTSTEFWTECVTNCGC